MGLELRREKPIKRLGLRLGLGRTVSILGRNLRELQLQATKTSFHGRLNFQAGLNIQTFKVRNQRPNRSLEQNELFYFVDTLCDQNV